MKLRRITILTLVAIAAGATGVAAAADFEGSWAWRQGDGTAFVGEPAGSTDLVLSAQGDVNVTAGHVRLVSSEGDFVFVHGNDGPATLNAYQLGTPTRTPIEIGAPAGVTPLIVEGTAGQTADLEQWQLDGKTVAAIDGEGRLRLGSITLDPQVVHGKVLLYADTGPGARQLLAAGKAKK